MDGNLTRRLQVPCKDTYTRSAFDRLLRVSSSGGSPNVLENNRYDISGIRKAKQDRNGNTSREYTAGIATSSSKPATSSSSSPSFSYITGHQLLGYDEGGSFRYFLTDALGTVRDVVDDTGAVIQSYEFDPHGIPMPGSGASSGTFAPKTYQGGLSVNDDRNDSGLYLMGHRHFDADLGRFISRDPIGFAGGLNLFNGAGTSPVSMVDPKGLGPDDSWWVALTNEVQGNIGNYLDYVEDASKDFIKDAKFRCQDGLGGKRGTNSLPTPNGNGKLGRVTDTANQDWVDQRNHYRHEAGLNEKGGLSGGSARGKPRGRFSANIKFFGPLKFLNLLNNINDLNSLKETICNGTEGPLEIPTIYIDGSDMDEFERLRNNRIYFLGPNIFQTVPVHPDDWT